MVAVIIQYHGSFIDKTDEWHHKSIQQHDRPKFFVIGWARRHRLRGGLIVFARDRFAQAPETLYIKCSGKGVGGWEKQGADMCVDGLLIVK